MFGIWYNNAVGVKLGVKLREQTVGALKNNGQKFVVFLDYESKGRGFESRRAHFPEALKNKRFRGFLYALGT